MKKIEILSCLTFVLSGLGCAATQATAPPPNYKGPIAEQPGFTSTDYWEYETAGEKENVTLKEVVQDGKVIRFEGDPFEEFEFPLCVLPRFA